ncbi:MAG: hypothetical protein COY53_06210 [Elusimicrobia bacterium CG_4_10_14_0_8_um_filter_37_32]|nr:MAG: hypothetical protein COS17_02665 [Elusimicrobia bacterium CG02_land_8_20_14_3_00_37_13]PIZ13172.1 MAG: hypothetical protein COY53_06210 [Elusimicrobia bacterium CG_4_10_14_0_8_um_filter_37_32]
MNATKILQSVGLNPGDSVFSIDNEEALEKILKFIKEFELRIKVKKIGKDDWETLFSGYAEAVTIYHSENYHQERVVFLSNEKMLKKYGLTDEDVARLGFC